MTTGSVRFEFGSIPISTKNPGAHFLGNLRKNLGSFENVAPGAMDWIAMPCGLPLYNTSDLVAQMPVPSGADSYRRNQ